MEPKLSITMITTASKTRKALQGVNEHINPPPTINF